MRKILFFDPKIVEIGLDEIFKDLDLEILKATSGDEAVSLLESTPVSMVISEMSSDGKWLLREVKGLDPQPPFVFLSSGPSGPSRYFKMGAQCCFPKTEEGLSLLKDFIDLWMKRDELYRKSWY